MLLIMVVGVSYPNNVAMSFKERMDDEAFALAKANARFVLVFYGRIEMVLLQEKKKYDDQLFTLHDGAERARNSLQETRQKRMLAEGQLEQLTAELQNLRRSLKTVDPTEKPDVLKRINMLEKKSSEKQIEVARLKDDEAVGEKLFRYSNNMYFAAKGSLTKESSRLNRELWSMFVKKDDWEKSRSAKDFAELKDLLIRKADNRGLVCSVTVISKSESGETTDAIIKYQTPEQRQYSAPPQTAKCQTRCTDQMKADRYYVWVERGNKATSSPKQIFPIGNESETITLIETPN